ncbi:septum formation protein Maf [Luteolibacter ambystomatis]|uniref:dTTP/UTP pyrophosphatase n=1 Tax=Luteolibacter ambystomatis TaxID=2824561 RepID=A0A975IY59_9BACT|nr:Maf family protein [Luteolibacter ambystomatis]QUE49543.1 septum formation protein Maf [Luteolibacter ambystomatis]
MKLILASASPRRRELLAAAGLSFGVVASPAEEIHDPAMPLDQLCEENAALKAEAVAVDHPDATVIGADTLVYIDCEPMGKPRSPEEARAMLRKLSGRSHTVCTGVCIIRPGGVRETFHALTEVEFRELDDAAIEGYLALVHTLDKAGGYGIQEHGDRIVSGIRGSYSNVVGLPVDEVVERLLGER